MKNMPGGHSMYKHHGKIRFLKILLVIALGLLLYNQLQLKEQLNHKNLVLDELEDRVDRLEGLVFEVK